jgi:hypothetical protein
MATKAEVLRKVYYNVNTGFGSIDTTLRQARAIDALINRDDVKRFLDRQEVRQRKKPNRYNSFIPNGRLDQIQIDLADFGAKAPTRYGFIAIDSFTKQAAVVPIKDKTGNSTGPALEQVLKVLGLPNTIVSDEGGEFQAPPFKRVLNYYSLDHLPLRSPPIFVERFIRTLREKIDVRLRALGRNDWTQVLKPVLEQYNNTKHTATGFTPLEAREPQNEDAVLQSITSRAKENRKYPPISVGDSVKILQKPGKYSEFKAGFNHWSDRTYNVTRISYEQGQARYFLEGYSEPNLGGHVRKPLLRHELLKVEGVEKPPRFRLTHKQAL